MSNYNSPSDAPDADALFERAELLLSLARYDEAIPLLHSALGSRPDDLKTVTNLGWAYNVSGNAVEGRRYLSSALHLPAVSTDDLLLRTWVLQSLGFRRKALRSAQAVFRADPENEDALYALAGNQLACGQIAAARTSALQLATLCPDFEGSYQVLAQASALKRKWSESERWCNEVLRCDPENTDFQTLRGKAIFRQRRPYEGIAALWVAAKQAPENKHARFWLDKAISDFLVPPVEMVSVALCLSTVGLVFYLLLAIGGCPLWLSMIIAGIGFIAVCPLSCWAGNDDIPQIKQDEYERLPPTVKEYCANGGYRPRRALLGLFVLIASFLPLCVMLLWTFVGEPTHLGTKYLTPNLRFAVEIAQLFGILGLPFVAVIIRKRWSPTFSMADTERERKFSDEEAEEIERVVQAVPHDNLPLSRLKPTRKPLIKENGY